MKIPVRSTWLPLGAMLLIFPAVAVLSGTEKKPGREEGEFKVYLQGKEIGTEKFVIFNGPEGASSNSVVEFRLPVPARQKVRIETHQEMNDHYVPRSYKCSIDIDGRKGEITSNITANEAMFEYRGSEQAKKNGFLVGDQYTILDTNVFHHFIFLVRLFDFGNSGKTQRMEVVIPQEMEDGVLKLQESNRVTILVRGKKIAARHLQADSGSLVMDLWVDEHHVLQKIGVPGKAIEVIRAR